MPVLLAVAALLVLVISGAAPAEAASESKPDIRRVKGLIAKPGAGAKLKARPLLIKVRPGRNARLTGVWLNGHQIADEFAPRSKHGLRRLEVSPSHGLRHGRNKLRVQSRHRGKHDLRVQRMRFKVARGRPLAAAGRDSTISDGAHVELDGTESRRHDKRQALRYRWKILRAPAGSRLAKGRRAHRAAGGKLANGGVKSLGPKPYARALRSSTPALKADIPGRYELELRVKAADGSIGTDRVVHKVVADPSVQIDTMAKPPGEKVWGVKVGDEFYPQSDGSPWWLQVVALKPDTLEPLPLSKGSKQIANLSIGCSGAAGPNYVTGLAKVEKCRDLLRTTLDGWKRDYPGDRSPLVIAVSQPPAASDDGVPKADQPAWQSAPPVGAVVPLSHIGGPSHPNIAIDPAQFWTNTDQPMLRGRMSVIGRLLQRAGDISGADSQAFRYNRDLANHRDNGEIRGFLLNDDQGSYTGFVSPQKVEFRDHAEPGSGLTANAIQIGDRSFSVAGTERCVEGGGGQCTKTERLPLNGFQVVIVDRWDLDGEAYYFPTGEANSEGAIAKTLVDMKTRLESAATKGAEKLVFVISVGDPRVPVGSGQEIAQSEQINNKARDLVDAMAFNLGATRTRLFQALDRGLTTGAQAPYYALVARWSTPPGHGLELIEPRGPNQGGAPLTGSLARSGYRDAVYADANARVGGSGRTAPDYGFAVDGVELGPLSSGPARLTREAAFAPPTAWPERGDAGKTAAIRWVGDQVGLDSERSLFWTKREAWTNQSVGNWDDRARVISRLSYEGNVPAIDRGKFTVDDFTWAQDELQDEIVWLKSVHANVAAFAEPFTDSALQEWAAVEQISAEINGLVQAGGGDQALANVEFGIEAGVGVTLELAGVPENAQLFEVLSALYGTGAEVAHAVDERGKEVEAGEPFEVKASDFGVELLNRMKAIQGAISDELVDVIVADYGRLKRVGQCAATLKACPDRDSWGPVSKQDQDAIANTVDSWARTTAYEALLPAKYDAVHPGWSPYRSTRYEDAGTVYQPAGVDAGLWWCPFSGSPASGQFSFPVWRDIAQGGSKRSRDAWQVAALAYRDSNKNENGFYPYNVPEAKVADPLFAPAPNGLGVDKETFYWQSGFGFRPEHTDFTNYPHDGSKNQWISRDSQPDGIRTSTCDPWTPLRNDQPPE